MVAYFPHICSWYGTSCCDVNTRLKKLKQCQSQICYAVITLDLKCVLQHNLHTVQKTAFFEYFVLPDGGLVEVAEWHSILQHDNNSITRLWLTVF